MGLTTVDAPRLSVDEFLLNFTCPICTEVLEEAIRTPCHHLFCQVCIKEALKHKLECPLDHLPLEPDQCVPDQLVRRIVGSLPSRCVHEAAGCGWQGFVSEHGAHLNLCDYVETPCKAAAQSCLRKVLRRDLRSHLDECPHWQGMCREQEEEEERVAREREQLKAREVETDQVIENDSSGSHNLRQCRTPSSSHLSSASLTGEAGPSRGTDGVENAPRRPRRPISQAPPTFQLSPLSSPRFLCTLVFYPGRLRGKLAHGDSSLGTLLWVTATGLTQLPFYFLWLSLGLNLLPNTPRAPSTVLCLLLACQTLMTWVAKRVAISMPFIFGLNIVDEIPVKFLIAIFFAFFSVLSSSGEVLFVDTSIAAASTVGIFVIFFIKNNTLNRRHSPLKYSVLDLLTCLTSICFVGLRSFVDIGLAFDAFLAVYGLVVCFSLGMLIELASHSHQSNLRVATENEYNFLAAVYEEWLITVMGVLLLFQGHGNAGVRVIYVVAAANFFKQFIFWWLQNLNLRPVTKTLLCMATFISWVLLTVNLFRLFGADFYWSLGETTFPWLAASASLLLLLASHIMAACGRMWIQRMVVPEPTM